MTNRVQRRAQARKPAPRLFDGLYFELTPPEAEIVEEALAMWRHQTRELFEDMGTGMTDTQAWALSRAEQMRGAIRAALEDRPWKDLDPRREPGA